MCARFIGIAEEPYIDEARSRRIVPEMLIERLQVDSFVVPPPRPGWLLYRIMGYRAGELRSFNRLSSDRVDTSDTLDNQSGNSSITAL